MTRVLLTGNSRSSSYSLINAKLLLRLAGFQVDVCEDLGIAINRYELFRHSAQAFDLVVWFFSAEQQALLDQVGAQNLFRKLILFHPEMFCHKRFCRVGSCIQLCHPKELLNCAWLLYEEPAEDRQERKGEMT